MPGCWECAGVKKVGGRVVASAEITGRVQQREEGAEGGGCNRGRRVQQRKDGCSRGMSVMVEARQSNVCASVAKREDYRLYCLYFFHLLLHQNIFHPHKGGTH